MYGSAIFSDGDAELTENLNTPGESALKYDYDGEHGTEKIIPAGTMFEAAGWFGDRIQIPNILYCPENIFANKIAMLDVNFIKPNSYTPVEYASGGGVMPDAETASESLVTRDDVGTKSLRAIISSWYQAFRNIAIVGLLIVLVYIGIRIMISSTSTDKAKYKENLQDWFIALCLVFFMHYLMSGILLVTESFTKLIDESISSNIYVDATQAKENDLAADDPMTRVKFKTTITGYIRFMTQLDDTGDCVAYSIMYFAMVIYTVMFSITYIKRFLYVAFFTMIAPLVALTYPLDKIRDGKAQAFSMWFKEYTMNVIIQPVHLLLFTVFIGSVMDLAASNPIYAIVTMGFMLPAEKFIKKLFGLESTSGASGLGEIAGGALAMKGASTLIGQLTGRGKKGQDGKNSKGQDKIRQRGIDPSITGSRTQDVLPEGYTNNSESAQNGGRQRNPNTSPTEGPQNPDRENPQQDEQQEENNQEFPQQDENNPGGYHTRVTVGSDGEFEVVREPLGPGEDNRNRQATENEGTTPTGEESSSGNQQQQRERNGQNSQQTGNAPVDDQPELPERQEPPRNPDNGRVRSPLGGVGAVLEKKARTLKRPFEKGNRLATAGKVARFTAKAAGTALGAAALGTVGLGAGLTSGDLSKTASLTSAGLTLGATAGNKLLAGGSIAAAGATARMVQNDIETYRRATRTAEQYEREEQEKMDEQWKRDPKNYEYLRNHDMSDKEAKDWLKSEKVARYRRETGISDIKTLHRTIKLMDKKNLSDDYGIHLAKMVDRTSPEFTKTEINNVSKNLQEQDGISLEAANEIIKDMKYIKDIKD